MTKTRGDQINYLGLDGAVALNVEESIRRVAVDGRFRNPASVRAIKRALLPILSHDVETVDKVVEILRMQGDADRSFESGSK